jgi:hypothetical protein
VCPVSLTTVHRTRFFLSAGTYAGTSPNKQEVQAHGGKTKAPAEGMNACRGSYPVQIAQSGCFQVRSSRSRNRDDI